MLHTQDLYRDEKLNMTDVGISSWSIQFIENDKKHLWVNSQFYEYICV